METHPVHEPPPYPQDNSCSLLFQYHPEFRPRPSTPTSSQSVIDAVKYLGTFAHFPFEIRRHILIAAFGERNLHLEYRDSQTPPPPPVNHLPNTLVGYARGAASISSIPPKRDLASARSRGQGCLHGYVCQHTHSITPTFQTPLTNSNRQKYPPCSHCYKDCTLSCTSHSKVALGAVNWLVTCRQAYAEGIDVLYSTNHFIIGTLILIQALLIGLQHDTVARKQLVFPQRLVSYATSLELRWGRHIQGMDQWIKGTIKIHIAALPGPFRNLRRLVLSFSDYLYRTDGESLELLRIVGHDPRIVPEYNSQFLQPVACLVSQLPFRARAGQVKVELPRALHRLLQRQEDLALQKEVVYDGHGYDDDGSPGSGDVRDGTSEPSMWLRYPVPHSRSILNHEGEAGNGDGRRRGDAGDDHGSYYYITANFGNIV